MQYDLNVDYIQTQTSMNSPLTKALLNYKGMIPEILGYVYSKRNMGFYGMDENVCTEMNRVHGPEIRHQAMLDNDSESYERWQDELAKELMDYINLPVFIEK